MNNVNKRPKIAFCGIEGAFASIAAGRIFPEGQRVAFHSFRSAYNSVVNGECDYAVLPIENSYAGEVGQVMDLIFEGDLHIRGIYSLPIAQNLLGVKGAKIEDIRTVISHQQALDQCYLYIQEHRFNPIATTNTAEAAKQVATKGDKSVAAIASLETAEMYGLDILEHTVNEARNNTTKFAVLEREMSSIINEDADKDIIVMMFTVPDTPGALSQILTSLGIFGYNMRVIRSRPLKGHKWTYYFYTEAEGDDTSIYGPMIEGLKRNCKHLKVLGHYSEVDEL